MQLVEAGKIEETTTPKNWVNAFLVAEMEKGRQRPIFEPRLNGSTVAPFLRYPSRLQRRWSWSKNSTFVANLDFAAFFDQFELATGIRDFFCFGDVFGRTWRLTRLPMGATWAPFVAQTLTWLLVFPLLELVSVDSCIDNIRIIGDCENNFRPAVRLLLDRIRSCNLTLNDRDIWDSEPTWMTKALMDGKEHVYCGEVFCRHNGKPSVRNSNKLIAKLRSASEKWLGGSELPTIRNLMSLVGLLNFMAHTLMVRVCDFPHLITGFAAVASLPSKGAHYDDKVPFIAPALRDDLGRLAKVCLENCPVEVFSRSPPCFEAEKYDAVAIVDASSTGVGAWIKIGSRTYQYQHQWCSAERFSSTAEPLGVVLVCDDIRRLLKMDSPSVAIVTDHQAIVMAQERWYNGSGGYGWGGALNDMFRKNKSCVFFFVPGCDNLADGLSRSKGEGTVETEFRFPSLKIFSHPYSNTPPRPFFMV